MKYSRTVKGTSTLPNGDEREIERTSITEFREVGTTKVDVPEDAKKKPGVCTPQASRSNRPLRASLPTGMCRMDGVPQPALSGRSDPRA